MTAPPVIGSRERERGKPCCQLSWGLRLSLMPQRNKLEKEKATVNLLYRTFNRFPMKTTNILSVQHWPHLGFKSFVTHLNISCAVSWKIKDKVSVLSDLITYKIALIKLPRPTDGFTEVQQVQLIQNLKKMKRAICFIDLHNTGNQNLILSAEIFLAIFSDRN